uniref:Uncharacterized protein n=1 Tax=Anguilla anguilla TaxID=7936 RepID=A0A0E9PED4_ANGAN
MWQCHEKSICPLPDFLCYCIFVCYCICAILNCFRSLDKM